MQRIKGIIGSYTCISCNSSQNFSEKFPVEKVLNFNCQHFIIVIVITRAKDIKILVKTQCKNCYKEYSSELKIGCKREDGNLIYSDIYNSLCCGSGVEVSMSLTEEYLEIAEAPRNNPSQNMNNMNNNMNNFNNNMNMNNFNNNMSMNNFNNNMNMNNFNNNFNNNPMNFNMNMNMNNMINFMNQMSFMNNNMFKNNMFNNMNNNMNNIMNNNMNNIMNEINIFDSANVIEFGKKRKLVNFLDENTNKNYKIYTSPELKLKNVLNDLLSQFPEINYNNNKLVLNGAYLNPELYINNCNLNDNSIIIIKN